MAAQALYRKWRSQTFDEVIGQDHVIRTLRNALRDGRVAHAYLFTGPRGTGKTSTARLLAKAVNCLNEDPRGRPDNTCSICLAITDGSLLDLIEIDAASNRGIDEIRDLRDRVHFAPGQARFKVYVIDEVHMLTPEAFNALLKTLEEPPPHVIFVLATTEPHKIPDTVLSRCQRFDFRRIPTHEIVERLGYILEQEGRGAEPAALEMIARSADGSMRDAISLADQLLSYGGELITAAQVQAVRGTVSSQAVVDLVDFMAQGDAAEGLLLINQLASEGVDLRQLSLQLVDHLRSVLLTNVGGPGARAILVDLSEEQREVVQAQAERLDATRLSWSIRLLNQAGMDMRDAAQPQLTLELAWLDAVKSAAASDGPSIAVVEGAGVPMASSLAGGVSSAGFPGPPTQMERAAATGGGRATGTPVPGLPRAQSYVPDDQVVAMLRTNWAALLHAAEVAGGGSLRGALKTLRHVVASGSDVHFAFEKEFSKRTVERAPNKAALQDLLSQLLGRPIRLHCQVGTEVTGVVPASASAAADVSSPPSPEPPATVEDGLANDPVVEHARRHLGAVTSSVAEEA